MRRSTFAFKYSDACYLFTPNGIPLYALFWQWSAIRALDLL